MTVAVFYAVSAVLAYSLVFEIDSTALPGPSASRPWLRGGSEDPQPACLGRVWPFIIPRLYT